MDTFIDGTTDIPFFNLFMQCFVVQVHTHTPITHSPKPTMAHTSLNTLGLYFPYTIKNGVPPFRGFVKKKKHRWEGDRRGDTLTWEAVPRQRRCRVVRLGRTGGDADWPAAHRAGVRLSVGAVTEAAARPPALRIWEQRKGREDEGPAVPVLRLITLTWRKPLTLNCSCNTCCSVTEVYQTLPIHKVESLAVYRLTNKPCGQEGSGSLNCLANA